jgi:hypothetical protein
MAEVMKLVRIKPTSPREVHVIFGRTFRKEKGWYKVPASLAAALADEPLSDTSPETGVKVFDVADEVVAKSIVVAETRKADPAGTVDRPAMCEDEPTAAPTFATLAAAAATSPAPTGRRMRHGAPPAPEPVVDPSDNEPEEPPTGEVIPGAPKARRARS